MVTKMMWHPMDLEVACKVIFRPRSSRVSGGAPAEVEESPRVTCNVLLCLLGETCMVVTATSLAQPPLRCRNSRRCPAQCELTRMPSSSASFLSSSEVRFTPLLLCSKDFTICLRVYALKACSSLV